jgi:hypothetical protein
LYPSSVEAGFCEPVEVEHSEITIDNEDVQKKVGDLTFNSITFNVIKPSAYS